MMPKRGAVLQESSDVTTLASAEDELLAQVACEKLFQSFHCLIDDGKARQAIDAFADDAVLDLRGGIYDRYEGREESSHF